MQSIIQDNISNLFWTIVLGIPHVMLILMYKMEHLGQWVQESQQVLLLQGMAGTGALLHQSTQQARRVQFAHSIF